MADLHIWVGPLLTIWCAVYVHGIVLAVAWRAQGAVRIFGVAAAVFGLLATSVYVPIAWQTSAYLGGRAATFAGMTVYYWSAFTAMGSMLVSGVAAYALHHCGYSLSRWWRRR